MKIDFSAIDKAVEKVIAKHEALFKFEMHASWLLYSMLILFLKFISIFSRWLSMGSPAAKLRYMRRRRAAAFRH